MAVKVEVIAKELEVEEELELMADVVPLTIVLGVVVDWPVDVSIA
jgi:hypothetical protein